MRMIYTRLLLTAVMLMVSVSASAYDFEVDGIYYNKLTENTCEVTYKDDSYNSYSGSVAIPSSVKYNNVKYSVTSIGGSAFYHCSSLLSITIPSCVNLIKEHAFADCSGLSSVTIPNSVTNIGFMAFSNCSGLTSVTIPSCVTNIGISAFAWCTSITSIKVESGNTVYDSRDNCNAIIETASNTLIQGCVNTMIPSSVASIGESAFEGCTNLTSITIPSGVTSIGLYAFCDCSGLTSITIPRSVISIGGWAFVDCLGLTSITIPSCVMSIGVSAFEYCTGLASIINLATTPQILEVNIFRNIAENVTLHVLPGCKAAYEAADVWKDFTIVEDAVDPTGIEQIENGKLKIGNSAVYNIDGRRLHAVPQKGICIKNGKKFLLK